MSNPVYPDIAITQAETVTYALYKVNTAFSAGSDTCSVGDILQFITITDTSVLQDLPTVSGTFYRAGYYLNLNTRKLFTVLEVPLANISILAGSSGGGGGGDATSANQVTGNNTLATIASNQTNGTQRTIIDSSALPTGGATSSLQTTGNTSLSSLDTKTPTVGQKTMAQSRPVVIASNQSALNTNISGGYISPARPVSSGTSQILLITTVRSDNISNSAFTILGAVAAQFLMYGYYFYNSNLAGVFVNIYNDTAPTIGTTTPLKTVFVPSGASVLLPCAFVAQFQTSAINGISMACVTTISGSTAPATPIYGEIQYQVYI